MSQIGKASTSLSSSSGLNASGFKVDHFWGGLGIENPPVIGTFCNLNPNTALIEKVAAIRFPLKCSINVKKVVMGQVNNDVAGLFGAVGIYSKSGNLIFQVPILPPGVSGALFNTTLTTPVTLQPDDYYFAWTCTAPVGTVFFVRALPMDEVINNMLNNDTVKRIGYSPNFITPGSLPPTLGVLTASDLTTDTGSASFPAALFLI